MSLPVQREASSGASLPDSLLNAGDQWHVLDHGIRIHVTAIVGMQPARSPALGRATHDWPAPEIGSGTEIGPYAIIYAGARIGRFCLVGSHAVIREGCVTGDRCLIGQGVFFNYEAVIGDDVRIIQGAHIGGMARIGNGTFIAPGVVMSNMRHIDIDNQIFDPSQAQAPIIGERVMIGTGANLVAGINIGDRAVIASGAIVTKDVPAGMMAKGCPAMLSEISSRTPFEQAMAEGMMS